jgi:YjbE family integral membrane protein
MRELAGASAVRQDDRRHCPWRPGKRGPASRAVVRAAVPNRRGDVTSILEQLSQPQFWIAVVQIIWIDLILSGDNAVVIALACRGLPPHQRRRGMIIGAGAAAALLIVFTIMVSALILLPYLRLASACALIWIAIKLVGPEQHDAAGTTEAAESLWRAVRIIVFADVVMGLDNAVAVAAVANGRYVLLGLGLAISIPIVFAGSAIVLALLERFPIIVWAGGAVLGWVAGGLFVSDPVIASRISALALAFQHSLDFADIAFEVLGATIVVLAGIIWRRAQTTTPQEGRDHPPHPGDKT